MFNRNITRAALYWFHIILAELSTKISSTCLCAEHLLSGIHVLTVCIIDLTLLQWGKVKEVWWPVNFVVEFLGVGQLQVVLHVGVMAHTCSTTSEQVYLIGPNYLHVFCTMQAMIWTWYLRNVSFVSKNHYLYCLNNRIACTALWSRAGQEKKNLIGTITEWKKQCVGLIFATQLHWGWQMWAHRFKLL